MRITLENINEKIRVLKSMSDYDYNLEIWRPGDFTNYALSIKTSGGGLLKLCSATGARNFYDLLDGIIIGIAIARKQYKI